MHWHQLRSQISQVFQLTSHIFGIFTLHFVSTIQLLYLYYFTQFLTCTRIFCGDSHCENGLVRCCLYRHKRVNGKLSGRVHEFREPTPRREQIVGEDLSAELQREQEGPQPTKSKDEAEAWKDFWSIQDHFIHHHHIELRVQLHVPREKHSPFH